MRVCLLASGSNGNACLVQQGDVRLLIDIGVGPRVLARRLKGLGLAPPEITHLVLTHAHQDHVSGLAALVARSPEIEIYASDSAARELTKVERHRVHRLRADQPVSLGPLAVTPFSVSHDAPGTIGLRLESPDATLGYATDLGCYDEHTVEMLSGADALVVEANHCETLLARGPYPSFLKQRVGGPSGHLSNRQCRALLERLVHPRLQHVTLAHLSEVNNTPAAVRTALKSLMRDLPERAWGLGSRTAAANPLVLDASSAQAGAKGQLGLPFPGR